LKVTKRDWGFITIVGTLLAILLVTTGREKPHKVPSDKKHLLLLDAVSSGKSREEVEKLCVSCHNVRAVPLPKKHPPKEQCLLCHVR
jgi:hypothetical protein